MSKLVSCGPIHHNQFRWEKVPGGVSGGPISFAPPAAHAFRADWIWLQKAKDDSSADPSVGCLRKQFDLKSAPVAATAWVSGDYRYRLYLNGRLVGRGPADPGEDYPGGKTKGDTGIYYADQYDATGWFAGGTQTIAVEVFSARLSDWWGSSKHPGFYFEADITLQNGEVISILTDSTWQGQGTRHFEWQGERTNSFPEREPRGWREGAFDSSTWLTCQSAGNHWLGLRLSEIPVPAEMDYAPHSFRNRVGATASKNSLAENGPYHLEGDGSFTLQFDKVISGYGAFKIKGPRGAQVCFDFSELRGTGRRSLVVTLSGETDIVETPFYTSFAFIHVTVTGASGPVFIENLHAIFCAYPVSYRGSFSCSDPGLNQLWTVSRWASQICMQDRFLDSPDHQEPISDPGDSVIESLIGYYAFADGGLARQELRKFGALLGCNDYVSFHTSYSQLWLQILVNYHLYTGDEELVRELLPEVTGLLQKFESWRGKNGLISEAPDYMFMDWVDVGGIACHHPPAVIGQGYLTAFYCRALQDGVRLATLVGDQKSARDWSALETEVKAVFERELWDSNRNRYRDGKPFQTSVPPGQWLPVDVEIETHSPHVSALAVLYDIAPKERHTALMSEVMSDTPLNCQPYFMHFIFAALAHACLFEKEAVAQLRKWKIDEDAQTFLEMWERGDLSHGWCGTPLIQLSSQVLGVVPKSPGFREVSIRPTPCGLQWARGTVPTPHGDLTVDWNQSGGKLHLSLTIPTGITAYVYPPKIEKPVLFDTAGTHQHVMEYTPPNP